MHRVSALVLVREYLMGCRRSYPEAYYGPGGRGGGKEGLWRGWDYWLGTGEYKDHEL